MDPSLEARIRRLEDIEEIRALKARYCQACDDDHNPDRVAALFVEGGLWEGEGIGVHARGLDAIRGYIGAVRASGRIRNSAHLVSNPVITVEGDRARGEWRIHNPLSRSRITNEPVARRSTATTSDAHARTKW